MKHAIFLLIFLIGGLIAKSQTQPVSIWNGSFEEWDTLRNGVIAPRNWTTIDTLLTGYQTVTRSTDAYSGKYAAKITALRDTSNYQMTFIPLILGTSYVKLNSYIDASHAGQPFGYQPKAITGYYKYTPNTTAGDSVYLYFVCDPKDKILFPFDLVASGSYTFQPSSSYQKFTIPTQSLGANIAVDTLLIYVYYMSKDKSAAPSGYLLIDDLKVEGALSVENTIVKKDFKVFPNPAAEFISVKDAEPNSTFEITDLAGRILLKGPMQNNRIDVRALSTGLYFLRVSTKEESWVEKLQIQ